MPERSTYVCSDSIQSTGSDHSHNNPEYRCKFIFFDNFTRARTHRENSESLLNRCVTTEVNRDIYIYLEMPQECAERRCRCKVHELCFYTIIRAVNVLLHSTVSLAISSRVHDSCSQHLDEFVSPLPSF